MGERPACGMHHEVGNGHFTAGDKRGQTCEQPKCDQETTHEFNNSAYKHQTLRATVSTPGKTEELLTAVTGEHQADDQSHQAIDRIRKSIQKVHAASVEMSIFGVKPTGVEARALTRRN